MQTTTIAYPHVRIEHLTRCLPALAALAFGFVLLYCVGFTTSQTVHNAAHDARHANGFPCH
jgi:cobalt transporter subunit CbtB